MQCNFDEPEAQEEAKPMHERQQAVCQNLHTYEKKKMKKELGGARV